MELTLKQHIKQRINSRAETRPWRNTWQPPGDVCESSGRIPTRHNNSNVSNTRLRQQSQSMFGGELRAHSQRLCQTRNVRNTLKMMVLMKISRRPRTVTDTRFTVGSVEQRHNSQTHKNTHKRANNGPPRTGTSTHLALSCLHTRWNQHSPHLHNKRDSFYGTTSPGDSDQLTVQSFTVSTWHAALGAGVESHLVEQRVVFDPRWRRAAEVGIVCKFIILAETGCQTNFLVTIVQQVVRGVVDLIWTETQKSHMV